MKTLRTLIFLALGICILSYSCKKGSNNTVIIKKTTPDSTIELAKLPPATETGAHTFACLVNGKAFIAPPGKITNGSYIGCSYTYNPAISYHFFINGSNFAGDTSTIVILATDSLRIVQGQTFTLKYFTSGTAGGIYERYVSATELSQYVTTNPVIGQLSITRLDSVAQIVSGTFWFDAIQGPGDTIHVRHGRFDVNVRYKTKL